MITFKPSRKSLHPKIIEFLEKVKEWHDENYYEYGVPNVDDLLKLCIGWDNGAFVILLQDGGKKYHGNCGLMVFNNEGVLVDDRIYFNPMEGQRVPKKAFIGTPIIDGSRPMKFKVRRRKDKPFQPQV